MSKIIVQLVILSGQILSRAFLRAIKQEMHASKEASQRIGQNTEKKSTQGIPMFGMSVDESKKILDLDHNKLNFEDLEKRFKFLYEANSKQKANSSYLQSKILQAKECLEKEIKKS